MNPNKALWEKGDFTRMAETMRQSGEELVAKLDITPGLEILELGCGDGTTALPEAKRGARVLGVDIASNLVAAGNRRAREQGLTNCGRDKTTQEENQFCFLPSEITKSSICRAMVSGSTPSLILTKA
ncbi:cyclopropane-fatty-acyl-phospholipid synthase family protein [Persicitalea sp.]|uniref:SAM-dependent methyltransferase n=1 Tax=Persicitalea sp. TaxID=3100273 RepID=UPI003592F79D